MLYNVSLGMFYGKLNVECECNIQLQLWYSIGYYMNFYWNGFEVLLILFCIDI